MNITTGAYTVQERSLELARGDTVRYTMALPPPSTAGAPRPLVVALHYGGRVTPYYGKPFLTNLILPGFAGLEAIMVAPDCPGEVWTDARAEEAILALIREVRKELSIDPRRILLTGYSLGAIGTWKLGLGHPELFSAAVAVSGMPPKGLAVGPSGPPVLVIHSTGDGLFPIGPLRAFLDFCRERGHRTELRLVPGLDHYASDAFVPALREAVPWVKAAWRKE